ncbi:uncharacterized protein LOC125842777 [Solanum stenotomum]|uniref:uncharacterized protein LOC125842777 n=1 Tax=Solanum stenotomum TaxID=172797 RepID=UPI0020D188D7|nr:uncharacterized protein LOC125842777 [Solanum stenotomum]
MTNEHTAVEHPQTLHNGQIASRSANGSATSGNLAPGQGIDYNHPLFLSPTDVSGMSIISFQLLGIENYILWSRSVRLALLGRNKIGLINGTSRNEERFDRVDGSRTYSLHKDITSLQQRTASVSVYYTRLKNLWDEFEALVPPPCCNCDKSKSFVVHLNRQKLYQFLMGLNESYHQARSQIFLMDLLPNINQAYAMIIGDESQKAVVTSTSGMDMTAVDLGHTGDHLSTNRYAGSVMFTTEFGGFAVPHYTKVASHAEREVQQLLQGCTFTKDKYDHILQIFQNKPEHTTSDGNVAHTAGATDHMVSNLDMLTKETVSKLEVPWTISPPNGDVTQVTYIGFCALSNRRALQWKGKEVGKEAGGLYVLLSQLNNYNKDSLCWFQAGLICAQLFKDLGIIHQRTCPYTPQQNRVAERKHRHLLEVTKTLRFQAKIPLKYWGHCVLAAAYVINRLPSSVLQFQTPYEKLYEKPPILTHLRTIGCLCFAKVLNEHDKLLPRSRSTIHMGYSDTKGVLIVGFTQ